MTLYLKRTIKGIMLCGAMLLTACSSNAQPSAQAPAPYLTLNNGVRMPQLGIGTYGIPNNDIAKDAISFALKNGFRHIDTAHAYFDEKGVGEGVKDSGVDRDSIWITSKLWPSDYTNADPDAAIDRMLKRLGTDHLDLLYIHQPVGDVKAAWHAMVRAYKAGKVRALGISNFDYDDPRCEALFRWFVDSAEMKPQVMQIECNPYAQRLDMREKIQKYNIQLECWFPLGGAMSNGALFRDPVIKKIAADHHKSPAQVIIRWHLQEGFSVIPGATDHNYIKENISVFDFALSQYEMNEIRALNKEDRFFKSTMESTARMCSQYKLND